LCGTPCREMIKHGSCSIGYSCLKCHRCQHSRQVDKRNQEVLAELDFGTRMEIGIQLMKEKVGEFDSLAVPIGEFLELLDHEHAAWKATNSQMTKTKVSHRDKQNLRRTLSKFNFGSVCRWTVLCTHLRSKPIATPQNIDLIRNKFWDVALALDAAHLAGSPNS